MVIGENCVGGKVGGRGGREKRAVASRPVWRVGISHRLGHRQAADHFAEPTESQIRARDVCFGEKMHFE